MNEEVESKSYEPTKNNVKYGDKIEEIEVLKYGQVSPSREKELARRARIEKNHLKRVTRKEYYPLRLASWFIGIGVFALVSGYAICKVQMQVDNNQEDVAVRVDGSVENSSEATAVVYQDWRLALVNESNPLEIAIPINLEQLSNGLEVDTRIKKSLEAMILAGKEQAGLDIVVCSAYRSKEYQAQLFNERVDLLIEEGKSYYSAYVEVLKETALPGTSEHELGLAVDLVGREYQSLDAKQSKTGTAIWLEENCYKYGFILRYPKGKEEITGKSYESWHFRYVGEDVAEIIMKEGITLEEYLNIK